MLSVISASGKPLKQQEVAAKLNMSPPEVCRALANLERKGFIKKGEATKRSKSFSLHPRFDWMLRAKNGKLTVIGPMERPV